MPHQPAAPITLLPPEILVRIFTFVAEPSSLISASQACRTFYAQIYDISADKYIWKAAARDACGFGGAGIGLDLGDIEQSFDNFVRGGIPETVEDLWAICMGPSVVNIRSNGISGEKGKEREGHSLTHIEIKPLYRDLCRAQLNWARLGVLKKRPVNNNDPKQPHSPAPLTAAEKFRRLTRTGFQAPRAFRRALARSLDSSFHMSKKSSTEADASNPKYQSSSPEYKQPETSLPPLTPPPDPSTQVTQRVFSIVHTASEGGRPEIGPPMVCAKVPTWAETLSEYPFGRNSTTFSIDSRQLGESEASQTQRLEWERRMACGGSNNDIGFIVFTDDPAIMAPGDINNNRFTVRRAVIGGCFGPRQRYQETEMQIDSESNTTGSPSQSNIAGFASSLPSAALGSNIDEDIAKVNEELAKIQCKSNAMRQANRPTPQAPSEQTTKEAPSSPEDSTPWLRQGKTFNDSCSEFIRPTSHNSIFPSMRRLDDSRKLKDSILNHFPSLSKYKNELETVGFSTGELDRWMRSTIYSDANLRIIPILRRRVRTRHGVQKTKTFIEAAEVERLTINHEHDNMTAGTVTNMRWILPKAQISLRLYSAQFVGTTNSPGGEGSMPTAGGTTNESSVQASIGEIASGSTTTVTNETLMGSVPSGLPQLLHQPILPPPTPNPFQIVTPAMIAAEMFNELNDYPPEDPNMEYRSRGPYLVCCDDNHGRYPSTISCFRAKPLNQPRTDSPMGDLIWQRLMVVPLSHHKDRTRHTITAEIRTVEKLRDINHEYYFLDNDGFKLTSSVVIYACRRHVVSPNLMHLHALRQHPTYQYLQSDDQLRDPWGIGTRTGNKAVCEFWIMSLETGHTLKIISMKEEERQVPTYWCGWMSWSVTDAGGLAATVGGYQDGLAWRKAVKAVRERDAQQHELSNLTKGKELTKEGPKKKSGSKEKEDITSPSATQHTSTDHDITNTVVNDDNDDGAWTTEPSDSSDSESIASSLLSMYASSDQSYTDSSYDGSDGDDDGYNHDDFEDDDEEDDHARERYQHNYLFCWDFSIHTSDESRDDDSDVRCQMLPLPSKSWATKSESYVATSNCGRYIVVSSKYRCAVWDLFSPGKVDAYKIPRKKVSQWKHANVFDKINDRRYYPTYSEENDDQECQAYNGVWIYWHDIAIPREGLPGKIGAHSSEANTMKLRTGMTFINNLDLRRYVDGTDAEREDFQRKTEYLDTVTEMKDQLELVVRNAHLFPRPQWLGGERREGDDEYSEFDDDDDDEDEDDGSDGDDDDDDYDNEDDGDDEDSYDDAGGPMMPPPNMGPTGYPGMPANMWAGLALLQEAFMVDATGAMANFGHLHDYMQNHVQSLQQHHHHHHHGETQEQGEGEGNEEGVTEGGGLAIDGAFDNGDGPNGGLNLPTGEADVTDAGAGAAATPSGIPVATGDGDDEDDDDTMPDLV